MGGGGGLKEASQRQEQELQVLREELTLKIQENGRTFLPAPKLSPFPPLPSPEELHMTQFDLKRQLEEQHSRGSAELLSA